MLRRGQERARDIDNKDDLQTALMTINVDEDKGESDYLLPLTVKESWGTSLVSLLSPLTSRLPIFFAMGHSKAPNHNSIPPTTELPAPQPIVRRLAPDNVNMTAHPYIRRVTETIFHLDECALRRPKDPNQLNIRVVTAASIGQYVEYDTAIRRAQSHKRELRNKPLGYDSFARIYNEGYSSGFYQMALWDSCDDCYYLGGLQVSIELFQINDAQRGLLNIDTVNRLKDMAADSALQNHQKRSWTGNGFPQTHHSRHDGPPHRHHDKGFSAPSHTRTTSMSSRDKAFHQLRQVEQQEAKKKDLQMRIQPSTPPNRHQPSRKRQVEESPTDTLVKARAAKAKASGRGRSKSPGVQAPDNKKARRNRKGGQINVGSIGLVVVEDKGEGTSGSSSASGGPESGEGAVAEESYEERLEELMREDVSETVPTGSAWTVMDDEDKMQD
ncbi:hypothetical protein CVT24_009353 [Panaeolus cyanescens]|uniref:Uncharacterized protein n=1 Tax=Panaeolus cyanescens TaxID=181874 RepID=A0A409WTP3_9AGAR|nr:hypothetical protein CVT24_009353 [Panaeolus cyanescens]